LAWSADKAISDSINIKQLHYGAMHENDLDPRPRRRRALETPAPASQRAFQGCVNEALREGLRALEEKPRPRAKAWTKPMSLGGSRIGSLDNIAEFLAIAEHEAFK
jgi:hypothetical protein